MTYSKKHLGYQSESIAKQYLIQKGYEFVCENYTIRGGEIDLIMNNSRNVLVFVEVKCVDAMNDVMGYVTSAKIRTLQKTIQRYCREHQYFGNIQLDLIFVKYGKVIDHLENIYL